ncbi:hypothetical protein C0995_016268 [Termitomyces sp. Mi166|nr:hypothetical protein C0995_016268 [Termitomyces sp. Mi166\
MFTKISLLKVSAGASLLEHEHATQDFIIAADNVFYKAQELIMIAPLHKMIAVELEPTVPVVVPEASMAPAPTPVSAALFIKCAPSVPYVAELSSPPMHISTMLITQRQPFQWAPIHSKSKEKAKVTKEDNDNEDEATQTLQEELENFIVPTTVSFLLYFSVLCT